MIEYPKRETFFAMRFLRLLTKCAAAMEIGHDGFALLMVIVGQEDACRYTRPVNFWNPQLATLIGLRGGDVDGLRRTRDRCIKAGWLQYQPGNKQSPARYFVTIPALVSDFGDSGSDESPREYAGNPASKAQETNQESAQNPRGIRVESAENPRPSIPSPPPFPISKSAAAPPPAQEKTPPEPGLFDHPNQTPRRPATPLRKTFADWRIMVAKRIFITDAERPEWTAMFDAEGWDEMTAAYERLAAATPEPGKIFLSSFQEIRV